jgi:hypothetical protein
LKLIKKLQECSTIGQADPILTRLGAGPAVKKLVETALILSNSQDPQQRNHAYAFMESAIKELENSDVTDENHPAVDKNKQGHLEHDQNEPVSPIQEEDDEDDDDIREQTNDEDRREREQNHDNEDKNEHKLHEEVLDNHNNGPREDGSEQSTENREPYPGTGRDSTNGEKPMQDMDNTQNQWNETGPGMPPNGMPPQPMQQNGGGMIVPNLPPTGPGLDPQIAQEMGMQMPTPPPLDTNQMMRQMQYTIDHKMRNYHNKVVAPLNRLLTQQKETIRSQKSAIKELSMQIREISNHSGNMKLDLDSLKKNATVKFRETESPSTLNGFDPTNNASAHSFSVQPLPNIQRHKIATARAEIEQMDKILNSERNPMYN